MVTKTVRGISPEAWAKLKSLAARKSTKIGRLIEEMIRYYDARADEVWDMVLSGKKLLSDKEAEDMEKAIKYHKKERWFNV
jgi:hypothetical protein